VVLIAFVLVLAPGPNLITTVDVWRIGGCMYPYLGVLYKTDVFPTFFPYDGKTHNMHNVAAADFRHHEAV
jgi:hypothetical protein